MFTKDKKQLNDVFPLRNNYSSQLYIQRPILERNFNKALDSNLCILLRGNSGCGKSWLTSYMLEKSDATYTFINLASANQYNSIYDIFLCKLNKIKTGYSETKEAEVGIPIARGLLQASNSYTLNYDYFVEYLKTLSGNKKYLVFDNFESIISNNKIINELGCLITRMDDPEIQEYTTRFIIIGTNPEIQSFFGGLPNRDTIDNRIFEMPEVKGFTIEESIKLIIEGFHALDIRVNQCAEFCKKIQSLTNGEPQKVHELARTIAETCHDNNVSVIDNPDFYSNELLRNSLQQWLSTSFSNNYSYLSFEFNNNLTSSKSLYNHVLFYLAEYDKIEFTLTQFYVGMTAYFPGIEAKLSKRATNMYLKRLASLEGNNNVLIEKGREIYTIRNYKNILCLRSMLHLKDDIVCMLDISEL